MSETRNSAVLRDFTEYCHANPDQRFWQALRNWHGGKFVCILDDSPEEVDSVSEIHDTFYWEGKNK